MRKLFLLFIAYITLSCNQLSSASATKTAGDGGSLSSIVRTGVYKSESCDMLVNNSTNATYITLITDGKKIVTSFNRKMKQHRRHNLVVREYDQYQRASAEYQGAFENEKIVYDQIRKFQIQKDHLRETVSINLYSWSQKCISTNDDYKCLQGNPPRSADLQCTGLKWLREKP